MTSPDSTGSIPSRRATATTSGSNICHTSNMTPRKLSDIEWETWQAKDPATLLFIQKDRRLLLIRKKRGLGAGKINGPGGRMEPGETPRQCAIREVEEELLVTPRDPAYGGVLRFQFVDGYSLHVHIFTATEFEGTPTETDEAVPLWTSIDALPYDEMWADDRLWLPLLLEGQEFSGRFIFDGDEMLDYELEKIGQPSRKRKRDRDEG